MENSFLTTTCQWCGEVYFVNEIGKGHGCSSEQTTRVEILKEAVPVKEVDEVIDLRVRRF